MGSSFINHRNRGAIVLGCLLILPACVRSAGSFDFPETQEPDRAEPRGWLGCEDGYVPIDEKDLSVFAKKPKDAELRKVVLLSSEKHGFENANYNYLYHCFPKKDPNCKTYFGRFTFNHGGSPSNLDASGDFVALDKESESKFDLIDFDSLETLNIKSADGIDLSIDTLMREPSANLRVAKGVNRINNYTSGSAFLLVHEGFLEFAILKVRIDRIVPGDEIELTYGQIISVDAGNYRNFYCSRQAEIKKRAELPVGRARVFLDGYSGYQATQFGFDYGTTTLEGRWVFSQPNIKFWSVRDCKKTPSKTGKCIDAGGEGELSAFSETQEPFFLIGQDSWPHIQAFDPRSGEGSELEEGKKYLVIDLSSEKFTFGAIRIDRIDDQERFVDITWKRIAIVDPYPFMQFEEQPIEPEAKKIHLTLGKGDGLTDFFSVLTGKPGDTYRAPANAFLYYYPSDGSLNIHSEYFDGRSGIIDFTSRATSLADISLATAENYLGQYSSKVTLGPNGVYLLNYQDIWFRSVMVIRVLDFKPGIEVSLGLNRVYLGKTFPESWRD